MIVMRALFVILLVGCSGQLDSLSAPGEKNGSGSGAGSGSGGALAECRIDGDCVAAGPKCCDCPTVAVPKSDPLHQACKDVTCPPPSCPDSVAAACDDGRCVLRCLPMACQTTCADGYALDDNGCLTCTCAQIDARSCGVDPDCAETRADCCGCARGGADTAVPKSELAAYDQSLMCPTDPQCPSVDTCVPGVGPRCIQGACLLTTATPPGACGRSDLPACAAGTACTVNANADATIQGVGICM